MGTFPETCLIWQNLLSNLSESHRQVRLSTTGRTAMSSLRFLAIFDSISSSSSYRISVRSLVAVNNRMKLKTPRLMKRNNSAPCAAASIRSYVFHFLYFFLVYRVSSQPNDEGTLYDPRKKDFGEVQIYDYEHKKYRNMNSG